MTFKQVNIVCTVPPLYRTCDAVYDEKRDATVVQTISQSPNGR